MHKFQFPNKVLDKKDLEEWLNSEKPDEIVMHFADQGGWPMDESFTVDSVKTEGESSTAQCTVKFDEMVNCGCGQSAVPHIHTFEIEFKA